MREISDPNSALYKSLFVTETSKTSQDQLFRLITVTIPNVSPIYVVDNNVDVVYGGITYTKFPIKFSEISVTNDGTINKASITVANPSRVWQSYVEQYNGLRGALVEVRAVYAKFLDNGTNPDPNANIYDSFEIVSYQSNELTIVFSLDPIIDLDINVPRRAYSANSCYFRYKDPETCGYSDLDPDNPIASCKKTLDDCKLHYIFKCSTGTVSIAANASVATFSGVNLDTVGIVPNDVITVGTKTFTVRSKINSTSVNTVETNDTTAVTNATYTIVRGNQRRFGGFPGINAGARSIRI